MERLDIILLTAAAVVCLALIGILIASFFVGGCAWATP